MAGYKSGYAPSDGYAVNAYTAVVDSKVPFTLVNGLNVEIQGPCGSATVYSSDFLATAGDYSAWEISKSPTGPWAASVATQCPELGVTTVYVRGDEELVLSTTLVTQDNMGLCDGCP